MYGRGAAPSFPSPRPPEKPGAKGSFFAGLTKPKQPVTPERPQRFLGARKPEKKTKLDTEIEKSIKEAKKLIKGEK